MKKNNTVFTIGHSNNSIKNFIELLKLVKTDILIDVRSSPYSKYQPHFNKLNIRADLIKHKIKYYYLGNCLGGRPKSDIFYDKGLINYQKLSKSEKYLVGIEVIYKLFPTNNITLMCAEKEPLICHRALLISKTLYDRTIEVVHIHKNKTLEGHEKLLKRLSPPVNLNLFE